ncbi:MAG: U32 family peptidase [Coriobacteriales bacterium]|nr:U32 family peptidase [Coriobacteriales bacterium]
MVNNVNTAPAAPKKPELLAPAGGLEQLRQALRFGADAVYLAAERFGLRARASNFELAELAQATALAHQQQAKVYVTCNALMSNQDIKDLPAYLEAFAAAKVDALIASDMAVFRLARTYAPQLALHVSTQASCSNAQAALSWQELGAKRIVCAREMSLADIAAMRSELPSELELEVFVHGAMCMAISGRCLISSFLNTRSANEGNCSQPCRWEYLLDEQEGLEQNPEQHLALEEKTRRGEFFALEEDAQGSYLMSSKDLCMLPHLDKLAATGVNSLKIEGRNKKAMYVATVVNAYRQVLDGAPASEFISELDTVSHRPYSTGFFFGPAQQAHDAKGYTQTHDLVAEVLSQHPGGRTEVICRNRFYEGELLEVLSPQQKVRSFEVKDLRYEGTAEDIASSTCASRAMETYSFISELDLKPLDLLRAKRKDSSKKN